MTPVAIVGMACRFPEDATSPQAFYDMLSNGRSAWGEVPKNRYNIDSYWHPNRERIGTTSARGAHWMKEDPAVFDAPFFSMTAAEASALDPQLRMLLEVAYECIENGGMRMEDLVGSDTSVFVGSSSSEYPFMMADDLDTLPLYAAVGTGMTMLANRLSHFYDLRGPSVALDTACSAGLVATHLGSQTIRNKESKVSFVCGSQLMLIPDGAVALSRLQFLSPSSRCYTFDDRANGYARGEGICVMMLKSLDDALKDGDTIRAVIRGSGTNQDGKTPGIVQPNSDAQAALIRETYQKAGLNYSDTQYFEAHGTGTRVGDPLELGSMATTFAMKQNTEQPLYVGSVKTNIGHLEGVAGLAGLLKTVLQLENGMIVPSLNYENPNPKLRLDEWHIKVPTTLTPWPTNGLRRASVNSFGYGGSNAHLILDDAYNYLRLRGLKGNTASVKETPTLPRILDDETGSDSEADSGHGTMTSSPHNETFMERPRLFVFSSPEQAALGRFAKLYSTYLQSKPSKFGTSDGFLANLGYSLSHRRSIFQWRSSAVASSCSDLSTVLEQPIKSSRTGKAPSIAMVFTGQGAQWHAMGRELRHYEIFSRSVAKADKYLRSLGADWSALTELDASEKDTRINKAKFSQPLCTVVQVALVDLLSHWGVTPSAVVGHSSGEIAAAYAVGAIAATDAWKIAYHRGRLSDQIPQLATKLKGSMMSVGLSEEAVRPYLQKLQSPETVAVACINSPSNVTLSGDTASLQQLEPGFKHDNVFARMLKVEVAYHSPHMRVIADQYLDSIKDIEILTAPSAATMYSSVTGAPITAQELNAAYWVKNMTSPVQFNKAVSAIFQGAGGARRRQRGGVDNILEVGPHAALQGPLRQILTTLGSAKDIEYNSILSRGKDAVVSSLDAIGNLWTKGLDIDLLRVNSYEANPEALQALTDMPNYPWNHTNRYWVESARMKSHRFKQTPRLDLLGMQVDDQNSHEPRWRNLIRIADVPWLADHKMGGSLLLPAASMLCAALEAAQQLADNDKKVLGYEFRDILIGRALLVPSNEGGIATVLHVKKRKAGPRASETFWHEFTFYSEPKDQDIVEHCSGFFRVEYAPKSGEPDAEKMAECEGMKAEFSKNQEICKKHIRPERFYEAWAPAGMQWGPMFQGITDMHASENVACTTVTVKDTAATMPASFEYEHLLHPTTMDSCFQSVFVPTITNHEGMLPTSVEYLYVSADLPKGEGAEFTGYSTLKRKGFNNYIGTTIMGDKDWTEPKIVMRGLGLTKLATDPELLTDKAPWEIRKICSTLVWKEDLQHVSPCEADSVFKQTAIGDQVAKWFELAGHKRPDQRILQIAAGTGSITLPVLKALDLHDGTNITCLKYVFSDSNKDQFEAAQKYLGSYKDQVQFSELDIEKDPAEQSQENESFDVIFAGDALRTSENVDTVLAHCLQLLKPNGKLVFIESEKPSLTIPEWNDHLKAANFSGIDIGTRPSRDGFSMAVTTKVAEAKLPIKELVILQKEDASRDVQILSENLSKIFTSLGIKVHISKLEEATNGEVESMFLAEKHVLCLLEAETPFISQMSEENFAQAKKIILGSLGGLWVTRSNRQIDPAGDPSFCPTTGLLRCVRSERSDHKTHEFSISSGAEIASQNIADLIGRSFRLNFEAESIELEAETETGELNGHLFVPRLYDDKNLNKSLEMRGKQLPVEQEKFSDPGPLKLEIGTPGMLDTLRFAHDDVPSELGEHEIEMEVQANGMNFVDIMVTMGLVQDTELGCDAAGVIRRVGSKVSLVKIGDRVATFSIGAYRSFLRAPESLVAKIPDDMSIEHAASLPCVYVTAYQSLYTIGRLEKDQTILIHSAAGGLGCAAIQIAQHIGAEIFVTAGNAVKRQLLIDEYGIPEDHIFNSRDLSFAKGIKRMTNGRGVDVVLNSLSGEALRRSWECVSQFGRFVEVGKRDILGNTGLDMSPFLNNVTFACVNMEHMLRHDKVMMANVLKKTFDLFRDGSVGLIKPTTVYKYGEIEKAFRVMQQSKHMGKLVLKSSPGDMVSVIPQAPHPVILHEDATYVIVGGLGGIGRSLALLHAQHGAKNLAIISRSGAASAEAKTTMAELKELGVTCKAYICDVADAAGFETTVERIHKEMPRIRGAVHCAMLLNDYAFFEMTYQQWIQTTRVKIAGAQNMHDFIPKDVDFFIMMSSASGYMGASTLSNYASGNTFLDGLSNHRRHLGLQSSAPGFGFIAGIGWAVDNVAVTEQFKADYDLMSIQANDVYSLIESSMTGYSYRESPMPSQMATCMGSGGELQGTKIIKTRYFYNDPKYAYIRKLDVGDNVGGEGNTQAGDLKNALGACTSLAQATDIVEAALAGKLALSMSMSVEDIDTSKPVSVYGVDSLVSMEIRNWVFGVLKSNIGMFDILRAGPMTQLAAKIAENSTLVKEEIRKEAASA